MISEKNIAIIDKIKSPYLRKKLVDNYCKDYIGNVECTSIADFIDSAFFWIKSPEGNEYWRQIYNFYYYNKYIELETDIDICKYYIIGNKKYFILFYGKLNLLSTQEPIIVLMPIDDYGYLNYNLSYFKQLLKNNSISVEKENQGDVQNRSIEEGQIQMSEM